MIAAIVGGCSDGGRGGGAGKLQDRSYPDSSADFSLNVPDDGVAGGLALNAEPDDVEYFTFGGRGLGGALQMRGEFILGAADLPVVNNDGTFAVSVTRSRNWSFRSSDSRGIVTVIQNTCLEVEDSGDETVVPEPDAGVTQQEYEGTLEYEEGSEECVSIVHAKIRNFEIEVDVEGGFEVSISAVPDALIDDDNATLLSGTDLEITGGGRLVGNCLAVNGSDVLLLDPDNTSTRCQDLFQNL